MKWQIKYFVEIYYKATKEMGLIAMNKQQCCSSWKLLFKLHMILDLQKKLWFRSTLPI